MTEKRERGGRRVRLFALSLTGLFVFGAWTAWPVSASGDGGVLEEPPRYGVYYDRYEPSFYTGFAPRADDPRRIHLHVGRGNQMRVTIVLSDEVIDSYVRDLQLREQTYRRFVEEGRIVLTQNTSFETFEHQIRDAGIDGIVAEEASLSPEARRERNLALLERLNPGRVFRITMPEHEVVRRWAAHVQDDDARSDDRRKLELLNAMLPTRLWITEIDRETGTALQELAKRARQPEIPPAELDAAFFALLDRVTNGFYPRKDGALRFVEFTAIYPVGTVNESTQYHGRSIPLYPTPGLRELTTHQRTKTADHIPEVNVYSYSPWIPYMHVGSRLHNAFHTLYWRMDTSTTSFLPSTWRAIDRGSRDGEAYRYLWLLSRGPMSHGCTHVNAGHIAELRQILPSESEQLYDVDVFLNKSHLYDVFDIDGDFTPEVMGVQYFIAYSLRDKKPDRLRAPDERKPFYDWLYGGEVRYRDDGRAYFEDIRDGRFVERTAVDGVEYQQVGLYEAAYESERIQFYRMVDIPFARELRKVGIQYPRPNPRGAKTES